METRTTRQIGKEFEDLACEYLQKQGLKLLKANYACDLGEIDLIFRDGEFIVFTEVRYRQRKDYGGAVASVTRSKQQHIIRTATFYLLENNEYEKTPCRFDVVAINNENNEHKIEWIKSAFDAFK